MASFLNRLVAKELGSSNLNATISSSSRAQRRSTRLRQSEAGSPVRSFVNTSVAGKNKMRPPEISSLYMSEFGGWGQLLARYVVIVLSAIALNVWHDMSVAPVWAAGYLICQALLMLVLSAYRLVSERVLNIIAAVAYIVAVGSFVWFPLYLLTTSETIKVAGGILGISALFAFSIQRPEPPKFVLVVDIFVVWTVLAVVVWTLIPSLEAMIDIVVLVMLCALTGFYHTMSLVTTRRHRRIIRESAERSFEAQKLEAIGRLSGGVAHDFNNLLTVIHGNLELYDELDTPPEKDTAVAEARLAAKRAAGLISQLLAFSRQSKLQKTTVLVDQVLEELAQMSSRLLPASVELVSQPSFSGAAVEVDSDGLTSSLLNLIINAKDAMEERGTIIVSARLDERAEGKEVVISVQDTGPGIPKDVRNRVLEPFFTTKEVGKGSGLGLSMALGFAEQSGGRLEIESQTTGPETGTTVSIVLPRHQG